MMDKSVILLSLLVGLTTVGFSEGNITTEQNKTQEDNKTERTKVEEKVIKRVSKPSDSMEEQIQKALVGVSSLTVLKTGSSKVVYESEAMVLDRDKPTKLKKVKVKRKNHRKTHLPKRKPVNMDDLPMAKTYPMDYELSKITE